MIEGDVSLGLGLWLWVSVEVEGYGIRARVRDKVRVTPELAGNVQSFFLPLVKDIGLGLRVKG